MSVTPEQLLQMMYQKDSPFSRFYGGGGNMEGAGRPSAESFPNIPVPEDEQNDIVAICNDFKKNATDSARAKHYVMKRCYAYANNKLMDGDLLPVLYPEGSEKDIDTQRPKVFIPVVKQIVNTLYSQLKLTLFPNDNNYVRIVGKTPEAERYEIELTEGFQWVLRKMKFTESMGRALYNLIWAGSTVCFPGIQQVKQIESFIDTDPSTMQPVYREREAQNEILPTIEVGNPMDFYPDPTTPNAGHSKWLLSVAKKSIELLDSPQYFNKERIKELASKTDRKNQLQTETTYRLGLDELENSFTDTEGNVILDLYYFPYLELTNKKSYRNMVVGVVENTALVRFQPNMFPKGLNPAVFATWRPHSESPYGVGPVEDVLDLQKLINIMHNYMVETMARIGNRFEVAENVDISKMFGLAGGVAVSEQIGSVRPLTGDYTEIIQLMNTIGTLKAEAQITAGAQNPFQGAAQVDFKKTATELQILQEQSINVMREVTEHVATQLVKPTLERVMYLASMMIKEPITIRVDDSKTGQQFINIDFSVLASGEFDVELTSINPGQSKMAQIDLYKELLGILTSNPQFFQFAKDGGYQIIKRLLMLAGERDIDDVMKTPQEIMQEQQEAAIQQQLMMEQAQGMDLYGA